MEAPVFLSVHPSSSFIYILLLAWTGASRNISFNHIKKYRGRRITVDILAATGIILTAITAIVAIGKAIITIINCIRKMRKARA